MATKAIPNRYKVPKKKWRRWTMSARKVFNSVYAEIRDNQSMLTHSGADPIKAPHWRVIAWNSAWIAADHASAIDRD